jgi:hypothetical protein
MKKVKTVFGEWLIRMKNISGTNEVGLLVGLISTNLEQYVGWKSAE